MISQKSRYERKVTLSFLDFRLKPEEGKKAQLRSKFEFWLLHKADISMLIWNCNLWLEMTLRILCITQEWLENSWELFLLLTEKTVDTAPLSWLEGSVEDKNRVVFFLHFMYCLFNVTVWEWCISIYQNLTSATGLSAKCCLVLFQIWFHYNTALSTF